MEAAFLAVLRAAFRIGLRLVAGLSRVAAVFEGAESIASVGRHRRFTAPGAPPLPCKRGFAAHRPLE